MQAEANIAGDIDRITAGPPPPLAADIRRKVSIYAETVVQLEWPALSGGEEAPAPG
ncbi:MAG: hypothetical protein JOY66_05985 [Acetobacteraceae bacterium]|nr:hypothetical protein [Acetobacteraceae bacterium]